MRLSFRTFAFCLLPLAFCLSLSADTPFFTDTFAGPSLNGSWSATGDYFLNNGLTNMGYSPGTSLRLLYSATMPTQPNGQPIQDYSVQSGLNCNGISGYPVVFTHYLRTSLYDSTQGYQVTATWDPSYGQLSIAVYAGSTYIAGTTASCATMKSSMQGSTLTVAVGGATVLSLSDSTYHTGIPGVGIANAGYGAYGYASMGTVVLGTPAPPNAPTNLAATNIYASSVNLSWNASTAPAGVTVASYNVYREDPGSSTFNNVGSASCAAAPATCQFSDLGLNPNAAYSYRVTALSTAGLESSPSNTVAATTAIPTYAPRDTGGAIEYAAKLAAGPGVAIGHAKLAIQQGYGGPMDMGLAIEREAIGRVFVSEDAEEGIKAFTEKRKPEFKSK